jgi:hypothetical protein
MMPNIAYKYYAKAGEAYMHDLINTGGHMEDGLGPKQ